MKSQKIILTAFLACLIFMGVPPAFAVDENIISNPGFEEGLTGGWRSYITGEPLGATEIVPGGISGNCVKMNYSGASIQPVNHYVLQILPNSSIVPGNIYELSADFKTSPTHYCYVFLYRLDHSTSPVSYKSFIIQLQGTGAWSHFKKLIRIPSDGNPEKHEWRIYLSAHNPLGHSDVVYYDNVALVDVTNSVPPNVYTEIEEMPGWVKGCRMFTDGYPLTAANPDMASLGNGVLALKGTQTTRNIYSITLPVKPETKYKMTFRLKIEQRKAYNYLLHRKPGDPNEPLYPAALSKIIGTGYNALNNTKGIWSGYAFVEVGEVGGALTNLMPHRDYGKPYIANSEVDWFNKEGSILTSKDAAELQIVLTLEGFDGILKIDNLKLEEVGTFIDDKYLEMPITGEFGGMKIKGISRNPLSVDTNAGRFEFSDNAVTFKKGDAVVGEIAFAQPDFLSNMTVSEGQGYVLIENRNVSFSAGADSSLITKFHREAEFTARGPRPSYHMFKAGVIFATDYEKGFFLSPIWPEQIVGAMPSAPDDSYFENLGLKKWLIMDDFDQGTWRIKYSLKSGDGIIASIFPPKDFSLNKHYKEPVNSFPYYISYYPEKDFSYSLQKFAERNKVVLLWAGSYDFSMNDQDPPGCYYVDANNNPVHPGAEGAKTILLPEAHDLNGPYYVKREAALRDFTAKAHEMGVKVIVYMTPFYYHSSDIDSLIANVKMLRDNYGIDGVYYDGLYKGNPLKTLELVRKTRNLLGENGFYMQHLSYEASFAKAGSAFRVPFFDAYADKILLGEHVKGVDYATWRLNYAGQNVGNTPSVLLPELRPVDYNLPPDESKALSWLPERQIDTQLNNNGEFWLFNAYKSVISDKKFNTKIEYKTNYYWNKFYAKALPFTKGDGIADVVETIITAPEDWAPLDANIGMRRNGREYICDTGVSVAQWLIDGEPLYKLHFNFNAPIAKDISGNRVSPSWNLGITSSAPDYMLTNDGRGVFDFSSGKTIYGDTDDNILLNDKDFSSFAVVMHRERNTVTAPQVVCSFGNGGVLYYGVENRKAVVYAVDGEKTPGTEIIIDDSSISYQGNKCLKMQRNDSTVQYTNQTGKSLEAGKTYKLSAWFKTDSLNSGYINIHNRTINKSYVSTAPAGNGQWQNLTVEMTVPAGEAGHSWQVLLYSYRGPSPIYYDAVSLVEVGRDGEEMLSNPGFEDDFSGWSHANSIPPVKILGGEIGRDQWHTIGVVYKKDSGTLSLYLDGEKQAQAQIQIAPFPENWKYTIGGKFTSDTANFFNGYVDDIFISDIALTDEQIVQYHQTKHARISLPGAERVTCIIDKGSSFATAKPAAGGVPSASVEIIPIGDKVIAEAQRLEFTVSAQGPDSDSLVYSAGPLPPGANFDPDTHIFTWTPGYNQAGVYQTTFTVYNVAGQAQETVTITVTNVNRAPALDPIGSKAIAEGNSLTFTVSAADPEGDSLTYLVSNLPAGATFTNRSFSWLPAYDQAGIYQLTFIASDGALQAQETININVTNTNRPPVFDPIDDKTTGEGNEVSFVIAAADPDGDGVAYSARNLPSGATFNDTTRVFNWVPAYDQAGVYDVWFRASDDELSTVGNITITVNDVNRSPTANAGADIIVNEGEMVTLSGSGSDPDGGQITYLWEPYGYELVLNGPTTPAPVFAAPQVDGDRSYILTLTVSDDQGASASDEVMVTVQNVLANDIDLQLLPRLAFTSKLNNATSYRYEIMLSNKGSDFKITGISIESFDNNNNAVPGLSADYSGEPLEDILLNKTLSIISYQGIGDGISIGDYLYFNNPVHGAEKVDLINWEQEYTLPGDSLILIAFPLQKLIGDSGASKIRVSVTGFPQIAPTNFITLRKDMFPIDYPDLNAYNLPVRGRWCIENSLRSGDPRAIGGVTEIRDGQIYTSNCARFGLDFMIRDAGGRQFRTDGLSNGDYYSWDQDVYAVGEGTVIAVVDTQPDNPSPNPSPNSPIISTGNVVLIDHGNNEISYYYHLKYGSIPVRPGDYVARGQYIGRVGSSGADTPRLRYQLIKDPSGYIVNSPPLGRQGGDWQELPEGLPTIFKDVYLIEESNKTYVNPGALDGDMLVEQNLPPQLTPIGARSMGRTGTITFTVNAEDPNGDNLIYAAQGLPAGATFDPETREFKWTPTFKVSGEFSVSVMFSVTDGYLSSSETATITVYPLANIYGHSPDAMCIADIDGDGKEDLVMDLGEARGGVWVRYSNGNLSNIYGHSPDNMLITDMDNDGKKDLVMNLGEAGGGIWVKYGNGSLLNIHGYSSESLLEADMDGDSKKDLIMNFGESRGGIWIRYNDGSLSNVHGYNPNAMYISDLDNDGKDDLVMDFGEARGGLWIRYNNGTLSNIHGYSPKNVLTADMDNDGKKDLVMDFGESRGGVWVRYGESSWFRPIGPIYPIDPIGPIMGLDSD